MVKIEELRAFLENKVNTLLNLNFRITYNVSDYINRDFTGLIIIQNLENNNKFAYLKTELIIKINARIYTNYLRIYHWVRIFNILLNEFGVSNLTSTIVYENNEYQESDDLGYYFLHFMFDLNVSSDLYKNDFFDNNSLIQDIFINDLGGRI
jgi:hypothetical protein